jgi:integrative and conjugative element protein (TIGR02256 family)
MTFERWSADRRYGVRVEAHQLAALRDECERAGHHETGGVLLGRYASRRDCAVVTEVVPPPADSSRGRTWFRRGVAGLARLFADRWRSERITYIGEWHFHPGAEPEASGQDRREIADVASSAEVRCPVPILLVVGLHPDLEIEAWVAPRGMAPVPLDQP